MKLIRFRYEGEKPRLGVVERGQVYDLAGQLPYATLGDLLAAEGRLSERIDELKSAVSGATAAFELTDLLTAGRQDVGGKRRACLRPRTSRKCGQAA